MKSLLLLLLGAAAGIFIYEFYQSRGAPRGNADYEIRRDLKQTGQAVRGKARQAGEKIGDAGISALIKARYVLDPELSALNIAIDTQDGVVTLTGVVSTEELARKATAIALDTEGVRKVNAKLTVK